jgi:hypothetical protein
MSQWQAPEAPSTVSQCDHKDSLQISMPSNPGGFLQDSKVLLVNKFSVISRF